MPQNDPGWRIEPPVSVPSEATASPAATAAADPPLEPPGTRSAASGLRTGTWAIRWRKGAPLRKRQVGVQLPVTRLNTLVICRCQFVRGNLLGSQRRRYSIDCPIRLHFRLNRFSSGHGFGRAAGVATKSL